MSLQIFTQRMFHAALYAGLSIQSNTHSNTLFGSPAHPSHSCHKLFFLCFLFFEQFSRGFSDGGTSCGCFIVDSPSPNTCGIEKPKCRPDQHTCIHTRIITKPMRRGPALMWVTGRSVHPSRISDLEQYQQGL